MTKTATKTPTKAKKPATKAVAKKAPAKTTAKRVEAKPAPTPKPARQKVAVQFYKNGRAVNPGDNCLSSLAWFFTKGIDGDRRLKSAELRALLTEKLGHGELESTSWDLLLPNGITLSARVPGDEPPPMLEEVRKSSSRSKGKTGVAGAARVVFHSAAMDEARAKKAGKVTETPILDRFNELHAANKLASGALDACREFGLTVPGDTAVVQSPATVVAAPTAAAAKKAPSKATRATQPRQVTPRPKGQPKPSRKS